MRLIAVAEEVLRRIAGPVGAQGAGVDGGVDVEVRAGGQHEPRVLGQRAVVEGHERLVDQVVVAGRELGRVEAAERHARDVEEPAQLGDARPGDLVVARVEDLRERDAPAVDDAFDDAPDLAREATGDLAGAVDERVRPERAQQLVDVLGRGGQVERLGAHLRGVLVDLGHGEDAALHVAGHLAQRLKLLLGGRGDALGGLGELLGELADPAHGLARGVRVGDAVAVGAGGVDGLAQRVEVGVGGGDDAGDAARLGLAVGGELADLVGHDAEGGAVGAGARGLDRRVERQQLGLVGDLLDDAREGGDLRELLGEALDALALGAHGLDGLDDPGQDRAPCSTSAARSPHMRADCSPASAASSAPLCRASTATATPSSSVRMWCTREDTAAVPIAVRAPPPLKARTARWTPLTMSATAEASSAS